VVDNGCPRIAFDYYLTRRRNRDRVKDGIEAVTGRKLETLVGGRGKRRRRRKRGD
jgi:hypothetical protein